jgi:hypothetical protein
MVGSLAKIRGSYWLLAASFWLLRVDAFQCDVRGIPGLLPAYPSPHGHLKNQYFSEQLFAKYSEVIT